MTVACALENFSYLLCPEIFEPRVEHDELFSFDYRCRFSRIRKKLKEAAGPLLSDHQSLN